MIRATLIAAVVLTAVPVMASADSFGAIAYSFAKDKYGRAWNYKSQKEAETAAIGFCKAAGGTRCAIGVTLKNDCGAFARSETSKNMSQSGSSWGFSSAGAAHKRAVDECEARDGAGTCRIIASVCSDRKE